MEEEAWGRGGWLVVSGLAGQVTGGGCVVATVGHLACCAERIRRFRTLPVLSSGFSLVWGFGHMLLGDV